jgi:hypothetical protein
MPQAEKFGGGYAAPEAPEIAGVRENLAVQILVGATYLIN